MEVFDQPGVDSTLAARVDQRSHQTDAHILLNKHQINSQKVSLLFINLEKFI